MDNICKICGEVFDKGGHFFKKHKIKECTYYQQYYPRFDLFTKEQIPFKSIEHYFNSDFIGKVNLKRYLESISNIEGLNYLKHWLSKRKENKGLIYSPSQFELRTLNYPSIKYFHRKYGIGSYELMCLQIGLINRYSYNQKIDYSSDEPEIIIDTREQKVLQISGNKEIRKLNYGDYSAKNNPFNIFVERKSLQDFLGSVSSGFDRLCREMQRAKDDNANVIILIESAIEKLLGFEYARHIHSKASLDFILKRTRDLLLRFNNVQIVCVDGRKVASEFITNIYKININPKSIDFQYEMDCKNIT